jgi:hypothetical protein
MNMFTISCCLEAISDLHVEGYSICINVSILVLLQDTAVVHCLRIGFAIRSYRGQSSLFHWLVRERNEQAQATQFAASLASVYPSGFGGQAATDRDTEQRAAVQFLLQFDKDFQIRSLEFLSEILV